MNAIFPNRIVISLFAVCFLAIAGCAPKEPTTDAVTSSPVEEADVAVAENPKLGFENFEYSGLSRVDQAYRLIQKQRSIFDPTNASVDPSQREYLTEVLALIDQAVVWRVSGMQAVARGEGDPDSWVESADKLLAGLRRLRVPHGLKEHHYLVQESLLAYQSFFKRWNGQRVMISRKLVNDDVDLRKATNFIRDAYAILMTVNERADRKAQADFYYTHMALDPS